LATFSAACLVPPEADRGGRREAVISKSM
jgi:hypothetical protein